MCQARDRRVGIKVGSAKHGARNKNIVDNSGNTQQNSIGTINLNLRLGEQLSVQTFKRIQKGNRHLSLQVIPPSNDDNSLIADNGARLKKNKSFVKVKAL